MSKGKKGLFRSHRVAKRPLDSFKRQALKMAREHVQNAAEWIDRKDVGWALVNARRAVKLLEVVD